MDTKNSNERKTIKNCVFTGHRDIPENFPKEELKREIVKLIGTGVDTFYTGMAIGFDLLAAETVLSLKKEYPFLKLVACVPCPYQEKKYSEKEKKRYGKILSEADEKKILSDFYYRGCMLARDRYMADNGDVLLAYCVKETGGTAYTVNYFKRKYPEKEIVYLSR